MPQIPPKIGTEWIDELTDEQCMEVFWLYVDPPEPFLRKYPPKLLGQAMRHALRAVAGAVDNSNDGADGRRAEGHRPAHRPSRTRGS